MFNPLRTRLGRLKTKIEEELLKEKPDKENIIKYVDEYQSDNLKTISKLKRKKQIEMARINGAIRQCIDAHGPITKELTGSASKRIYGNLLESGNEKFTFKPISFRDVLIGMIIFLIFFIIFLA